MPGSPDSPLIVGTELRVFRVAVHERLDEGTDRYDALATLAGEIQRGLDQAGAGAVPAQGDRNLGVVEVQPAAGPVIVDERDVPAQIEFEPAQRRIVGHDFAHCGSCMRTRSRKMPP